MGIQFNSKDFKSFRLTMSKAYSGYHTLNDFILKRNDEIANANRQLDTNTDDLTKLENGEKGVLRDKDTILADNERILAELKIKSEELVKAREDKNEAISGAYALVDKFGLGTKSSPNTIYNSYVSYVTDGNKDAYLEALALFFGNGATPSDCERFAISIGKRNTSTRTAFKNGKLRCEKSYKQWRDEFVREMCDTLVDCNAITTYKYRYVTPKKNK